VSIIPPAPDVPDVPDPAVPVPAMLEHPANNITIVAIITFFILFLLESKTTENSAVYAPAFYYSPGFQVRQSARGLPRHVLMQRRQFADPS
jgi:hypothetical protein